MSTEVIADELNRLYTYEMDKYIGECDYWKKMGYKIYRNSMGLHRVIPPPEQPQSFYDENFGDVFNSIFGGSIF